MRVDIIKERDTVYDVYDATTGEWLVSRIAPENIFHELVELGVINSFTDKDFERKCGVINYDANC